MAFLTSKLLRSSRNLGLPSPSQVPVQQSGQAVQVQENQQTQQEASSPYDHAIGEAADQHYGKESKVNTLLQAVLVDQLDGIAQDELDTVSRFRDMKVFGYTQEELKARRKTLEDAEAKDVAGRTITICDNYSITHPQPPSPVAPALPQPKNAFLPWVLVAALGSGLLGAGVTKWLNKPKETDTKPAPTNTSTVQGVGSTTELVQPK